MAFVSQAKKKTLAVEIKKVLKEYGVKGSIAVQHNSSLVVTLKSGKVDFGDAVQVNEYWIKDSFEGVAREFLTKLLAAMKGPDWFDKSDSQSDYFHVSHYTNIKLGKWDTDYVLIK